MLLELIVNAGTFRHSEMSWSIFGSECLLTEFS